MDLSSSFFFSSGRCLKEIRAIVADLIKQATNTAGSGAGEGLEVVDEEKSTSAAYLKAVEAQAYEEPFKGERPYFKINVMFNRGVCEAAHD